MTFPSDALTPPVMRGAVDGEPGLNAVTLLDGGLATELEARGADLSGPLWSARLLRDQPGLIREVHRAYFAAGAEVATTASYQASVPGFARLGIGEAEAVALIARSVSLAREAMPSGEGKIVAGSIGPYGAALADGSEYRGDYTLADAELSAFHVPRLRALLEAGTDWLACETLPHFGEIRALAGLVDCHGAAAWFSLSTRDEAHLADGTPVETVAAFLDGVPTCRAIGVNCLAPARVLPLLRRLRGATRKPLVAYPNAGEIYGDGVWVGEAAGDTIPALAPSWIEAGARLVGGCCRVGPATIAALAATLSRGLAGSDERQ